MRRKITTDYITRIKTIGGEQASVSAEQSNINLPASVSPEAALSLNILKNGV